jgi:radical S-adenosyl methionine domain-containing protein 2
MVAPLLPPTVNMHVVGHCNFGCQYCYARFETAKKFLPLAAACTILGQLREHGARRITFAGGEPTLHPDLEGMLRECAHLELVTSIVTNGSVDRDRCRRLFPWTRWLVVSCDSHLRLTNDTLGRQLRVDPIGQVARVEQLVSWLHEWNLNRPAADHVLLKVNIVVTSVNADEDPSEWLAHLHPARVKLLQCCIVPGENDDAEHLRCPDDAFAAYHSRLAHLSEAGIIVVAERSGDLLDSYAMVDPLGRFRQARSGGYVESAPIVDVGVAQAWSEVGGCDMARFRARGGEYESGQPCRGASAPIVAIEGLDGSGKSTVVRELAAKMGAAVVTSPPAHMSADRAAADGLPPAERRAWYWRANREAMKNATDHVFQGTPVVMDRCFATTAVYAAAELGRVATPGDVPRDVLRPDIVFLLTVPEDARQERLRGRGSARTAEEDRLTADDAFRQRVLDGYVSLGAHHVDAAGTVESVVAAVVAEIEAWRARG